MTMRNSTKTLVSFRWRLRRFAEVDMIQAAEENSKIYKLGNLDVLFISYRKNRWSFPSNFSFLEFAKVLAVDSNCNLICD